MAIAEIIMPKLGESIMEATVLRWHKQVGDLIRNDETLLDIATDKVDSEVPSSAEGIIEELLYKENDVVPIGAVIARIRLTTASSSQEQPQTIAPQLETEPAEVQVPFTPPSTTSVPSIPVDISYNAPAATSGAGRFYSPLVMNIASSEGIGLAELESIPGTGNDGRVTKKDIITYLERKANGNIAYVKPAPTPVQEIPVQHTHQVAAVQPQPAKLQQSASVSTPSPAPVPPTESYTGNVEVIEMDRMRRMISEHMTKSLSTSAHVTSFAEADVTNLVKWRDKIKSSFEKREGEKITFTPLFIDAIVKTLKNYPYINASVQGDKILLKKDINIGMATALPNGNLIVPVIRNADQLSILGLVKQVNRLASNARDGKLQPSDTQDGTFTFTNIGTFGSLMGTPIINQPQVAILAIGAIKKKPVVIESEKGDSIAIRHMMFVSMSYDHRIIDGGMGSKFLGDFVKAIESFDPNSSI